MTADEINKLAEAVNRWICANGRAYRHLDDMGEVVNPIVYTTFHDARLGDDYVEFVPVKFEELVALREQLRAALAASPSAPAASSEDARADSALLDWLQNTPASLEEWMNNNGELGWRVTVYFQKLNFHSRREIAWGATARDAIRAAIAATPEAPK